MPSLNDLDRFEDALVAELDRLGAHRSTDRPYVKRWILRLDGRDVTTGTT